jgi:hypothetical protein
MPQQVQMSPTLPDGGESQRPDREREMRVRGDAGVFGALLGALQAGEAGIVRGEARNDSAAEWNARDARQGRQQPREGAQGLTARAQEPREALERLAGTGRPVNGASVAASDPVDTPEAPSQSEQKVGRSGGAPRPSVSGAAPEPMAPNAAQVRSPAGTQAVAAPVAVAVSAGATAGASGPTGQTAQASAIEASRGPQGGAAHGRAPSPASTNADRALRFERAFEAQVGRGLAQALRSGDGTVTLRLRPQHLGQLQVRVQVEDQRVTATFEARSAEAQRLLEDSRDSLRQQLEARGLRVERIEVRLVEEAPQSGTRFADVADGGAEVGQDGRAFAGDREGRGSSRGDGADGGSHRGAAREDDEPVATAEPWRALGTVRLNAIA